MVDLEAEVALVVLEQMYLEQLQEQIVLQRLLCHYQALVVYPLLLVLAVQEIQLYPMLQVQMVVLLLLIQFLPLEVEAVEITTDK